MKKHSFFPPELKVALATFEEALAPLLAGRRIETAFQPIVSIRRGKVIALEALSRFPDAQGHVISPLEMFQKGQEAGLRRELDWLCLHAALRQFPAHHQLHPRTLVFLNIHADTLIDARQDALPRLIELADHYGIPHPNIALELLESSVSAAQTQALRQIVQQFKENGFLVALDDLGIESSNLDRILLVNPDMIKADRSLVDKLDGDLYKQSIFQGLAEIAERIGGWLVAEGVETQRDALCALDIGGDLMQGYLFGRPAPMATINECFESLSDPILRTGAAFRHHQIAQARVANQQRREREQIMGKIVDLVAGLPRAMIEATLCAAIKSYPRQIESACYLDAEGIQQTDALINPRPFQSEKAVVYQPAGKGDSHALKEYFYLLMDLPEQPDYFETKPYVPLPTTDVCITRTTRFQDAHGNIGILCLHLRL